METTGITISQENSSEVKFMSDESIVKLFNSKMWDDNTLACTFMFKKYPKLIKYVSPCTVKGNEHRHQILYKDIMNNSPLYGIVNYTQEGKRSEGISFKWDEMFDYLWT